MRKLRGGGGAKGSETPTALNYRWECEPGEQAEIYIDARQVLRQIHPAEAFELRQAVESLIARIDEFVREWSHGTPD